MLPLKISDRQLELLKDVLQLPELKRLSNISFLGAIDHISKIHSQQYNIYSRYDHTKGVIRNTLLYMVNRYDRLDNEYVVNSIIVSAFHDIGHIPFSHSLESLYKKNKLKNHHNRTLEIIDSSKNISSLFEKYNIRKCDIIDIMSNRYKDKVYSYILDDNINMDTIDGIFRSIASFGKGIGIYNDMIKRIILSYSKINKARNNKERCLFKEDLEYLDLFWKLKGLTYRDIIQSKYGISCDTALKWFFENNSINIEEDSDDHFYIDKIIKFFHKSKEFEKFTNVDVKFNEFFIYKFKYNIDSRYSRKRYNKNYIENIFNWKLKENFLKVYKSTCNTHKLIIETQYMKGKGNANLYN